MLDVVDEPSLGCGSIDFLPLRSISLSENKGIFELDIKGPFSPPFRGLMIQQESGRDSRG